MSQIEVVEVERQDITVVEVTIPGPQGPGAAATDIPFTPAGTIAATNVQDAIEELDSEKASIDQANIEDSAYGAVGDDNTVNTTAIQAALDSGRAWIYVPEGIFRSAQLTIPSTVKRIYGPGTLKATGSISNFFLVSETGLADFTLECVIDVSPSSYPLVAALCFSGSVNSKAKGAYFKNSGRFALWQRDGSLNCGVEDSRIEGFAQCAVNVDDFADDCVGAFVRNNKIKNTASCTGHIVHIIDSTNPVVEGNKIDGNGSPQFGVFIGSCINPDTHNNEIKNTTKEAIHYGSTAKGKIRDNDCDWPDNASNDFGISVAADGPTSAAATDTLISGNYVRRAGKSGIAVIGDSPGGSMAGNIVIDPNQLGGSNPTPTHSNGFELYDSGAEDWHVAGNLAISNDGNMTYGFSEVPTEPGADNNTFEGNRSIGHATGEVNLSGASSKWNQPTISPDEAYDATGWNGDLSPPSKNAVRDKIETLQPLDADLTTFAGLSPSNDDVLQRKAGAWANRTIAQLTTDLAGITNDKVLTAKNTPNSGEWAKYTASGIEGRTTAELVSDATLLQQGKTAVFIPAAYFNPEVTNGAQRALTSLATNLQIQESLDFDQSTQEFANCLVVPPKGWNAGTITFVPHWTAASGSGGVVWELQAAAVSNDDPLNPSWGTGQTSTDTLTATGDLCQGPESAAITIGGTPAKLDAVWLRIKRNVSDGSDDLNADARLLGVTVYFTTDAPTDA